MTKRINIKVKDIIVPTHYEVVIDTIIKHCRFQLSKNAT